MRSRRYFTFLCIITLYTAVNVFLCNQITLTRLEGLRIKWTLLLESKYASSSAANDVNNVTSTTPTQTAVPRRDLPLCSSDVIKKMVPLEVNGTEPTWRQLEAGLPMFQEGQGGHYNPPGCRATHHVSIVIPYRDRETHLKLFLRHMHPFLQAQELKYTIYVVELEKGVIFKKGLLMNAGFLEASKNNESECFVFHDIDMLPMNGGFDYACAQNTVKHPARFVRQYKFLPNYGTYVGGVLIFHKEDFRRVNGFSNLYWGWGGEDDDMSKRLDKMKIRLEQPSLNTLRFESWAHKREDEFINRNEFVERAQERMHAEGLNSAEYTVLRTERRRLYTWLYVSANQTSGAYKDLVPRHGPNSKDRIKNGDLRARGETTLN